MLIAKYTANTSGVLPVFNDGYQYTINETESNGVYTVEISSDDDFTSCNFKDKKGLLTVDYLKITDKVTTMAHLFSGCKTLTSVNTKDFDTSNVTSMNNMFYNCSSLTQLDVSSFNTSKVATMNNMFRGCVKLTGLDLSNFDTSDVTSMDSLFRDCAKLTQLDLSSFNTSKVTNMAFLFGYCSSLSQIDLRNFNTENAKRMDSMFRNCVNLAQLDLSNFKTNVVVTMEYMFYECSSLTTLDVSNFNTIMVTKTTDMFTKVSKLQHIGMIYCDHNTVNTIANALPTVSDLTRTIYIQDTKSDIYTPRDSIVFYDYKDSRTIITLPQQLNSGDMLIWDDSLRRYILKKSDDTVIEIDTNAKYVLDVVGSYYRIETDEKESAPTSMTVKLYISKDVL